EVKALFGLIGTSSGGTYILLDQHYTLPIDVRTADASMADSSQLNLPAVNFSSFDINNLLQNAGDTSSSDMSALDMLADDSNNSFGITFPILTKPANVIQLLLGHDVDLVRVTLPKISGGFTYTQEFPIFGPLVAVLSGGVKLTVQGTFAYDTFGMR